MKRPARGRSGERCAVPSVTRFAGTVAARRWSADDGIWRIAGQQFPEGRRKHVTMPVRVKEKAHGFRTREAGAVADGRTAGAR
jgi:hypothetical protein